MFVDHFAVVIQLIEHAVRNVHVQLVADQVMHGGSCFVLVRPVIHLGGPFLNFCQQLHRKLLDLVDVTLGKAVGEEQVVDGYA